MKLSDFLKITESDDYFLVNIMQNRACLFFGYTDSLPENINNLIVENVYIDWASQCLGIHVKQ